MIGVVKNRFYMLFAAILLLSSGAIAGNAILCKSFYLNPVSIEFGKLFQEAKDVETLEILNEHSKDLIFANAEPDPLDHLINTLLFYRGLERLLLPSEFEKQFGRRDYRFLYRTIKMGAHGESAKFNYFRRHLLKRDRPVQNEELTYH